MDLRHPANAGKSKDIRYLKKILTDVEIELVRDSGNPDRTLWSFWACKETAYKVIGKSYAGLSFLPRLWPVKLNLHNEGLTDGEVIMSEECTVFIRLFSSENYVHCIGSNIAANLDKIMPGIESLPESASATNFEPSIFARECLMVRLAEIYKLNPELMEVRRLKKNGELQPPNLYYENKKTLFDISLSHDGRFVAYAFFLPGNNYQ